MPAEENEPVGDMEVNGEDLFHIRIDSAHHPECDVRPRPAGKDESRNRNYEPEDGILDEPMKWQRFEPIQIDHPGIMWQQIKKEMRHHPDTECACAQGRVVLHQ